MLIGVNIAFYRPGKIGGGEVYVQELLRRFGGLERHRFLVFCWEGAAAELEHGENVEIVPVFRGDYTHGRRLLAENVVVRDIVRARGVDVVWGAGNAAIPGVAPVPQVVTVHDLQHLWFPEHYTPLRRWFRRITLEMTLRVTDRFITVSEFTKRDLIHRCRVPSERVSAVPLGVQPVEVNETQVAQVRARYGLPGQYLYYPAALWPHKNHELALQVLARVRLLPELRNVVLVLSGDRSSGAGVLHERATALAVSDGVRHVGFVPRADVFSLMAGAGAVLFPSRFEGFGLPILEAQHCGAAVISSNVASLPEVAGDGAVMLGPDDVDGWADAASRLLRSHAVRRELVARGARNAARFSWDACVDRTVNVLERAARR